MKLTIAIPTYNRVPVLRNSLCKLLPQLNSECELLILDNASTLNVENEISELIQSYSCKFSIRVIRHESNIGGNANILRCIELSRGEWVWILGDDDPPVEGALELIFNKINGSQNLAMMNFKSPIGGAGSCEVIGGHNLLRIMDFGNFLFLSTSVFRRDLFIKYLADGYEAISTCAPHTAIALSVSVSENAKFLFIDQCIVDWEASPVSERWNFLRVNVRMQSLLEHARLNHSERMLLAAAMAKGAYAWYWLFVDIVSICLAIKDKTHSKQDCLFYWREKFSRHNHVRRLGLRRMLYYVGEVSFIVPALALSLARIYLRVKGKSDDLSMYALSKWNNRSL